MSETPSIGAELRETVRLAMPITAGMLSQILLGIADTAMVGKLGVTPLAACSLVNALVHIPMVLSIGILSSVGVLGANAGGSKDGSKAGEVLRHGALLAILTGLGTWASAWLALPYLDQMGQDAEAVEASRTYLLLFSASILPAMVAHVGKQYCEALNHPWIANGILFGGVILNIFFNWILIYGNLGAPAMGLDGAGWATILARVITAMVMFGMIVAAKGLKEYQPKQWFGRLNKETMGQLWHIGWPSGLQHLLEVGAFVLAAIMMGWISAEALAAHQIAMNCAATTFMFMLGIAVAVCIRIGKAQGAGEWQRVRRIGFSGQMIACGVMLFFAVVFMTLNHQIAGFFTDEPELVDLAGRLILIAAIFQLADGSQVVGINALRGLKDVRVPALVAGFSYWLIAAPLAWFLAFKTPMGPSGIWWGLATGLLVAAISFAWRFHLLSLPQAQKNPDL